MNGIINVLKPTQMTSHDVVSIMRRLLWTKKIGHTGTLDPNAVGVLPICVGKATKVVEHLTNDQKTYRCGLQFGSSTDTQDRWGTILERSDIMPTEEDVLQALQSFKGVIDQIPPMFSALKVNGQKLVDLARQGQVIERKARKQTIYSIEIIRFTENGLWMDVTCSKGTYIRTICHDLGQKLGCYAHMTHLIRMSSGSFKIEDSLTLEEIALYIEKGDKDLLFKGLDEPFKNIPACDISKFALSKILNGIKIDLSGFLNELPLTDQSYRLYCDNDFIGIGTFNLEEKKLQLTKRLYCGDES